MRKVTCWFGISVLVLSVLFLGVNSGVWYFSYYSQPAPNGDYQKFRDDWYYHKSGLFMAAPAFMLTAMAGAGIALATLPKEKKEKA